MQVVDRGNGLPLVLIPGIQGRWEYLRPTVDALAESFRTVTFALLGTRTSKSGNTPGIDDLADQVLSVLDERGIRRAVICGISFGGLVALRFAARFPERTIALVLVSTPGPDFRLSARHLTYIRMPWLFGPLFLIETPRRLQAELRIAFPKVLDRLRFGWRQASTLVTAPLSLRGMAARGRLITAWKPSDDAAALSALSALPVPTLVVTGEPSLDRVVRVGSTLAYVPLIPDARSAELAGTGHIGYLTKPRAFVKLIGDFLASVGALKHDAA
jgi:pimeloyl-ACP methyl ester carboxylesterase